ncbi:MAG: hypothetical protein ABIJ05_01990 [Patescibacteria group bacterium]
MHKDQQNNTDEYNLTEETVRLVENYKRIIEEEKTQGPYIHVDEIASKVAHFYENIRAVIDWKEEHLLRRTAIERNLKRRLMYEISGVRLINTLNVDQLSESLALELIRGGHFPNDRIPRAKILEVKDILERYIYILENNPLSGKASNLKIKDRVNFFNWVIEIAACEIEELLIPPLKEMVLINFMSEVMFRKIQIDPSIKISDDEKFIQIYIASQLTLFRLDKSIVLYRLIKLKYPRWIKTSKEDMDFLTENVIKIKEDVEKDFEHQLSNDFYIACEEYDTLFLIICDVFERLSKEGQSNFSDEMSNWKKFAEKVVDVYNIRSASLKSRLFKMATFSTLSVLISSAVSLYIVEVPIAKILYGRFMPLAMLVDILLPTLLMFILVSLVKPPGEKNLENLLIQLRKIVYKNDEFEFYEIRAKKKIGFLLRLFVTIFYLLAAGISLGVIFWIFYLAKVPIASVYIDTINVAVIVSAALLIRQKSKELLVEEKSTFWEFILDTMSVPIGKIGQWVSEKWKEYNIVSVFFTVLVDMPFQTIVDVVENLSLFIKDKKARLR